MSLSVVTASEAAVVRVCREPAIGKGNLIGAGVEEARRGCSIFDISLVSSFSSFSCFAVAGLKWVAAHLAIGEITRSGADARVIVGADSVMLAPGWVPTATRAVRVDPSRRGNVGGGPLADEYPVQPAVP